MTEAEWLVCEDPFRLLRFLRAGRWWRGLLPRWLDTRRPSVRKMRLLACAYERMHIPPDERFDKLRLVLTTAERYADGEATVEELRSNDPEVVRLGAVEDELIPTFQWWEQNWGYVRLLRCIINPFHHPALNPTWKTQAVVQLARSLYEERRFEDMPVLADALEEAGCQDAAVLGHCRGPGPHIRGCWVLDLLLGKE
jgi:hypothetical protein